MSKTDRIFYHERRKSFQKIKEINIKTDLKDQIINDKLLNYKCQDYNIILNYQIPQKKKSIFSFSKSNKKNKSILNVINEDLNKTEIKFNNMELLTDSSFQETIANTSFDSQKSSKTEYKNNTFKILLNEDYNTYTDILKKIYPSFEFNHYNKIKDEYYKYFVKYGDNDINNRNSKYYSGKININEKYKQSNLIDILGVQKNIVDSPEQFKIKDDFLSRTDITELKMIKDDLSFKTGIIDKELETILESQANRFYNHIENNANFVKLISNYSNEIKLKNELQKIIKANYITNSMKLLLREKKKKELEKLLNISYYMNDLKKYIYNVRNLSATSNKDEKIFEEIKEKANLAKEKIIYLKNIFNNKKCKFLSDAENIINIYGNKDNLNLVESFTSNLKNLIESCIINEKNNDIFLKDNFNNISKDINKNYWLLVIKEKSFDNILFTENDFEYFDNNKSIYCKYLLIYKNKDKLNLFKLLINVLDLLNTIIIKKTDINLIISIFQEIFKNIIYFNLKEIENKTTNKLLLIKIISNCYSILLSNYCYIICLLKKNFHINTNNFNGVTNLMKNEMNNIIIDLIKSYLFEILEQDWKYFIEGYTYAKNNCEIYFKINKLNWDKTTFDFYKKFILDFNESQTRELTNEYNKNNGLNLSWDILNNIDIKYQKMFDKLYFCQNIDKIALKELDINQKIDINNNIGLFDNSQKNNLIYFINEINEIDSGHKISNFSCLFINYAYEYLYTYILTNDSSLKKILIDQLYKVSKDLLLYSKDIFVNNANGSINNNKKITEKEISLFYSDLLIIENCLKNFLIIYPEQDINIILNQLKNKSIENIENSIKKINDNIIQELNNISFDNYPSFIDGKEINNYAKYFNKLKEIYDDLINAFTSEKIKEIFNQKFEILFNNLNKIIIAKGGIKNENGYMQFISDIIFIKKIITIMDLVDYNSFNETLDKCIRDSIKITI